MVGPVNFSTNEECGVLVRGFESSPAVMMPHNPVTTRSSSNAQGWRKKRTCSRIVSKAATARRRG
jgi:hypothetical protein